MAAVAADLRLDLQALYVEITGMTMSLQPLYLLAHYGWLVISDMQVITNTEQAHGRSYLLRIGPRAQAWSTLPPCLLVPP